MRDYSTTALIIFPKQINMESKYTTLLNGSVRNMVHYLGTQDVTSYCFNTDEMAVSLKAQGVQWLAPLSESDEFFARNNCTNGDALPKGIRLDSHIEAAIKKYPVGRGLSRDQRFDVMQNRENFVVRRYIKETKLVIVFGKGKNQMYKVESKVGDPFVRVFIDPNTLIVKPMLGGRELNALDIFDFSESTRPIYQWKEENYIKV